MEQSFVAKPEKLFPNHRCEVEGIRNGRFDTRNEHLDVQEIF